jgi:hypothetical protein
MIGTPYLVIMRIVFYHCATASVHRVEYFMPCYVLSGKSFFITLMKMSIRWNIVGLFRGAMTFNKETWAIMTFNIKTFSITTFSRMTFSIMTFSIMTFSITTLNITTFSVMTFSKET